MAASLNGVGKDKSSRGKKPSKRESVISQLRKEEAAAAAPETETVCSLLRRLSNGSSWRVSGAEW